MTVKCNYVDCTDDASMVIYVSAHSTMSNRCHRHSLCEQCKRKFAAFEIDYAIEIEFVCKDCYIVEMLERLSQQLQELKNPLPHLLTKPLGEWAKTAEA